MSQLRRARKCKNGFCRIKLPCVFLLFNTITVWNFVLDYVYVCNMFQMSPTARTVTQVLNTTGKYQRQNMVRNVNDGIALTVLTQTCTLIYRKIIAGTQLDTEMGRGASQSLYGISVIFLYAHVVRISSGNLRITDIRCKSVHYWSIGAIWYIPVCLSGSLFVRPSIYIHFPYFSLIYLRYRLQQFGPRS